MDPSPVCQKKNCTYSGAGYRLKTFEIVNNEEDGSTMIWCERDILNSLVTERKCSFCENWMFGSGLFIGEEEFCVKCLIGSGDGIHGMLDFIRFEAQKDKCLLAKIFPAIGYNDAGGNKKLCDVCQKIHSNNDWTKTQYICSSEIIRCVQFTSVDIKGIQLALNDEKYADLLDFMRGFRSFKTEKLAELRALQEAETEKCTSSSKRIIRSFFPEISEEQCEQIIPPCYRTRESLDTQYLLTDKDIVAFVYWLRQKI